MESILRQSSARRWLYAQRVNAIATYVFRSCSTYCVRRGKGDINGVFLDVCNFCTEMWVFYKDKSRGGMLDSKYFHKASTITASQYRCWLEAGAPQMGGHTDVDSEWGHTTKMKEMEMVVQLRQRRSYSSQLIYRSCGPKETKATAAHIAAASPRPLVSSKSSIAIFFPSFAMGSMAGPDVFSTAVDPAAEG